MNLSKSKYCTGLVCPKRLWLETYKSQLIESNENDTTLENGHIVGELAKNIFGNHIDIKYNDDLQTMINETNKYLEQKDVVITEASFNYNNNFCSIDVLKKNNSSVEIYEVKSSTSIKDIYLDDISYQTYILKSLGYNISKSSIIYINSSYIRKGDLELNKLFIIKDVTNEIVSKVKEVPDKINNINRYITKDEPQINISLSCYEPYNDQCPFFNYCTKNLPKPNVFDISQMTKKEKFKLYNLNKISFNDLIEEKLDSKYYQQIDFEINNKKPYINKNKLKEFMNTLSYPLYFLDFETYQEPIPSYDGMHPYEQIPFQYSLHYLEKESGELKHKEFLAEKGIDPRRYLAERLVKDIPENVCTLAYNMMFEKMVIKNLANLYPDLKEHLMNIHSNIKDLLIPFRNREYYTKEMKGSYSIKYVLPALYPNEPSLNYHNLNLVHRGTEASAAYINLSKITKKEEQELREALLRYCELDTYAMVKVYEKIKKIFE